MGWFSFLNKSVRDLMTNADDIKMIAQDGAKLYESYEAAQADHRITSEEWALLGKQFLPVISSLFRLATKLGWVK